MKKVIEGKIYNTETATLIGSYSYGYAGDYHSLLEELYITKKGALFLYGEGGAGTTYSIQESSNSYTSGSNITLLTRNEAFEWCQKQNEIGAIEQYFSEMVEEA